jgi:hypothetical protein
MISLVTAFIAAVVAVIAFLQWQTAREKVLLDLFDKRFTIYEEARAVVRRHITTGIDQRGAADFERAALRARFLFGPKVQAFLEDRRKDIDAEMQDRIRHPRPIPEDERDALDAAHIDRLNRLGAFSDDFDKLAEPYMNHHQKALTFSSLVGLARQMAAKALGKPA